MFIRISKKEAAILFIAIFFGVGVYSASAQVPGDFDVNCQTGCSGVNNDVLNCNNKTVAPFVDFNWGQSSGATRYEVYYKNTSFGQWTGPVATITDINNRRYAANVPLDSQNHYYIKAINSSGFKSCSMSYIPGRGGGCKSPNTDYPSSDEGAEANCQLPPPLPPTCTVSFNPATISAGGFTTQTWTSSNDADGALQYTCNGNLGPGVLPVSGSRQVAPATTQTCTFTARNTANTSITCSATITVNPLPPPPPPPPPPSGPPVPPDITPPVITNVRITNVTTTSANVLWNTDEAADSQVEFCTGFTRCGVNTTLAPSLVMNHSVALSGLTPATTYKIWVKSKDVAGNLAVLGYFLFTTLTQPTVTPTPSGSVTPTPPPPPPPGSGPVVISNVRVGNITRDSATVTWNTDRPADGRASSCFFIFFCYGSSVVNPVLTVNHSVDLTGLRPERKYYVRVFSSDTPGNESSSDLITFTTLPGLVISNISVSPTRSSAVISWDTNYPADSDLQVCRTLFFCYFGSKASDQSQVMAHSLSVSDLNPGTRYYYRITSTETLGYSAIIYANFTTPP